MQNAGALLSIIGERGKKGLPLERIYRQLWNEELYLIAYGRLYPNNGAMTPGVTPETVASFWRRTTNPRSASALTVYVKEQVARQR